MLEGKLAEGQYAYQRARSTEVLLADLDRFVAERREDGWTTYMVGLDIAGAFDGAGLGELAETQILRDSDADMQVYRNVVGREKLPHQVMHTGGGAVYGSPRRP